MEDTFLESIAYILPAIVTGLVALYMFKSFMIQQQSERKMEVVSKKRQEILPTKLKAYERMLLFCDRINPSKLVIRIEPISDNEKEYSILLIKTIEQEFEHNFLQQLYITDETWSSVLSLKTILIHQIKQIAENSNSLKEFRDKILLNTPKTDAKIELVSSVIKKEIRQLL